MVNRTVYLVSYRNASRQRAHFAIFVPKASDPQRGTIIHVIGAPMAGYRLEFKRNYCPAETSRAHDLVPIGDVNADNIVDSSTTARSADSNPKGNLEVVASQVLPPRISENFSAPVNDTTNRRCQEWTTDYVRRLVTVGYISETAIDTVQSHRDPPNFGIGLRPAGGGRVLE